MPSTIGPANPSGAAQESDVAPSSEALSGRRGGGHPRRLAVQLVALAEPRDQHAALPAVRGLLVGHGDLARARLGLPALDERLEVLLAELLALEQRHHARVGGGVGGMRPCGR